ARSGRLLTPLAGHKNLVVDISFSPDGNFVVTASRDRTARVWKADNGQQVALLAGHRESVGEATFSPNGRAVLKASADGTARCWDPKAQPHLRLLVRQAGPIMDAAYARGLGVLVAGESGARLVRPSDGSLIRRFAVPVEATAGIASPDGKLVAVST